MEGVWRCVARWGGASNSDLVLAVADLARDCVTLPEWVVGQPEQSKSWNTRSVESDHER